MAKKMASFFSKWYGFHQNIYFGEEYGIIFAGLGNIMMMTYKRQIGEKNGIILCVAAEERQQCFGIKYEIKI